MKIDIVATTLSAQARMMTLCEEYVFDQMLEHGKDRGEDRSGEVKTVTRQLIHGTPYYLDRAVMPPLVETAVDVPLSAVLTPDMFPTDAGFVWFARPWPLVTDEGVEDFTAFSWDCIETIEEPGVPAVYSLCAWGLDDQKIRYIIGADRWGKPLSEIKGGMIHARAVYALLAFMKKKILVAARVNHTSRQQRRAAEWTDPPEVFVIVYRKTKATSARHTEDPDSPDWQFRWIQRHHWGIRYHGSGDDRVPVVTLISAGIKGPEGKPMRISPTTLGAIIR